MRRKSILLVRCSSSLCLYDGLKQILPPTTIIDSANNCSWEKERTGPLFLIPRIWVYFYGSNTLSRFISSSGFVSKYLLFHLVPVLVWEIHPKLLMTFQDTAAPGTGLAFRWSDRTKFSERNVGAILLREESTERLVWYSISPKWLHLLYESP
jgi:hypothetical protein